MLLTSVFIEAAAAAILELRQDTFQGLTLWRDDCIAVGMVNMCTFIFLDLSFDIKLD